MLLIARLHKYDIGVTDSVAFSECYACTESGQGHMTGRWLILASENSDRLGQLSVFFENLPNHMLQVAVNKLTCESNGSYVHVCVANTIQTSLEVNPFPWNFFHCIDD